MASARRAKCGGLVAVPFYCGPGKEKIAVVVDCHAPVWVFITSVMNGFNGVFEVIFVERDGNFFGRAGPR